MMGNFQPIMQPAQVATTARYYNDVFVPLGKEVTPMMSAQHVARFQSYTEGLRRRSDGHRKARSGACASDAHDAGAGAEDDGRHSSRP